MEQIHLLDMGQCSPPSRIPRPPIHIRSDPSAEPTQVCLHHLDTPSKPSTRDDREEILCCITSNHMESRGWETRGGVKGEEEVGEVGKLSGNCQHSLAISGATLEINQAACLHTTESVHTAASPVMKLLICERISSCINQGKRGAKLTYISAAEAQLA